MSDRLGRRPIMLTGMGMQAAGFIAFAALAGTPAAYWQTILPLVEAMESGKLIYASGEGKKGDPKKYFATKVIVGKPLVEAPVTPALKKCEYEGCNNTASNAISTAWQGEYCGHEHWRAAQSGVGVQSCIQ